MFYLSLVGLAIGALAGLLQAFERLDVNLYDDVGLESYYQGLTLHGVTLALVLTFNFASAFMSLTTMRGFGRPMASRGLSWTACGLAWAGVVLAAAAMLTNKATVLFTFYAPLQAASIFYVGAVFLVVSTWVVLLNMVLTYRAVAQGAPGRADPPPGLRLDDDLHHVVHRLAGHRHRGAGLHPARGRSGGRRASTRSSPGPCSGSPATRSSTSGCCRSTCPGT